MDIICSHIEDQQYLMCYLKISKNLILKKSLFLQLNSISSIKLMLMRYKLLINLAFIFSPLLSSLSNFNQQIVYINFVWFHTSVFWIIICDLLTCVLRQQRFCFHAFHFYALLFIRFDLIIRFSLTLQLYNLMSYNTSLISLKPEFHSWLLSFNPYHII